MLCHVCSSRVRRPVTVSQSFPPMAFPVRGNFKHAPRRREESNECPCPHHLASAVTARGYSCSLHIPHTFPPCSVSLKQFRCFIRRLGLQSKRDLTSSP